jgi:hypothetical protein
MDFFNIKAAAIELIVDENLLTTELLSIPNDQWDAGYDQRSGCSWQSIFLRINNTQNFTDFKSAKVLQHDEWYWNNSFNIPYIKKLVESLPVVNIGMIRAFILEGSFPMHTDTNNTTPDDLSFKLGLTIAARLDDPMILDGVEVFEKNILFNDAVPHGFPNAKGKQISIRIFGDFDYDKFKVLRIYE